MEMLKIKSLIAGLFLLPAFTSNAQNSASVMETGKKFHIQSAMNYKRDNGGYLDIPGTFTLINKGSNIQVWNLDNGEDRKFTLTNSNEVGYYEIIIGNTQESRVDVAKGSTKNGTNVLVWEKNGGNSQKFTFLHLGNGRFKILDRNGKILTLYNRASSNGSNVQIWDNQDGVWAEWYVIDPETKKAYIPTETVAYEETKLIGDSIPIGQNFWIQSAMDYGRDNAGYWDLPGNDSKMAQGSNIQVWNIDGGKDRLYRVEKKFDSQYYQIYVGNMSDGVVDISGGKNENGTNVQLWKKNNKPAQDFYFKHLGTGRYKIYNRNHKIINLEGRKNNNGSNVHLWEDHQGIQNEWYFVNPTTKKAYIPDLSKPAIPNNTDNSSNTNSNNSENPSKSVRK